jgi:hypothetical protein
MIALPLLWTIWFDWCQENFNSILTDGCYESNIEYGNTKYMQIFR